MKCKSNNRRFSQHAQAPFKQVCDYDASLLLHKKTNLNQLML